MNRVLITGVGSGLGQEVAMRLASKGFEVIAAVEIYAQVQTLKRQAAERSLTLRVEKLDVTDEGDRPQALAWDVEILVDNAGVGERARANAVWTFGLGLSRSVRRVPDPTGVPQKWTQIGHETSDSH